ncbi:MAG TPA: hypothetical protein VGI77_00960 [Gaiellaceae bacterium]|jgi:hypothetical protein
MTSPLAFWVGTWDVHDSVTGEYAGSNEIVTILEGHAVLERWRGGERARGHEPLLGRRRLGTWHQVWATRDAWEVGFDAV